MVAMDIFFRLMAMTHADHSSGLSPGLSQSVKLGLLLQSQSATSIIGYGQLARVQAQDPSLAYDTDLAFDILGLSFPLTIVLNSVACLTGPYFLRGLPFIGLLLIAAALVLSCLVY